MNHKMLLHGKLPKQLYTLKHNKTVLGTGSIAFGFKNENDAKQVAEQVTHVYTKIWYTAISPGKFTLTSNNEIFKTTLMSSLVQSKDFLDEMLASNLTVRIIEEIKIDYGIYTLYSSYGYVPFYSRDEAIIMLEKHLMI
jgi:hypothetical protein